MATLAATVLGFVLEHWPWLAGIGGAGLALFIPGAGPVLAVLRANWKWLVPLAIAAAAVALALWYRAEWKDCQASVAIDANKAEERLRGQQQADSELRRQLSETLAPIVNDLRKQANDTQVALAKVQSDPRCGGTDAARAYDRIVQPAAGGKAGAGAPGPARR